MNASIARDEPADLTWNDAYLMGYPPMDRTHEAFVGLLQQVKLADGPAIATALEALLLHTREHFESENRWMRETDFPPRDCHIDEHNAVLASIEEVLALAQAGDLANVQPLADALTTWFPGHLDYLDSALSHWLCARQHGGKPVVLRRNVLTATPSAPSR